jgi:hypothetical protein
MTPRVRTGLQHHLQGGGSMEAEEGESLRLEDDMLLFGSPLNRPPNEDETLGFGADKLASGQGISRRQPKPDSAPTTGAFG